MGNDSLKALLDHATRNLNPSQNTSEHNKAYEKYSEALNELKKLTVNMRISYMKPLTISPITKYTRHLFWGTEKP